MHMLTNFGRFSTGVLFLAIAVASKAALAADDSIIRGSIQFSGTPPEMAKIRLAADPTCIEAHPGEPPRRQDVIVNRNSTLKNVIVYVKSGLPGGKSYPLPTESQTLDQRGCMYEPHVFAIRVGQELKILNSDPTVHNIQSKSQVNEKFNEFMTSNKVPPRVHKFAKPELPVPIKCDVHPWMLAWAGVFDHPFFAVTSEDGTYAIKGLPAGEYTIAAWHEKYGTQEQKVKVGDAEAKDLNFTFKDPGGAPVTQ
jgi:hypothetical protein